MQLEDLTALLKRRWLTFLLALVASMLAIVAVTSQLPRTYQATATLFVDGPADSEATVLDTTQGEQLARTYTALASTPAVADAVLEAIGGEMDRDELLAQMAFAPVERTQLLTITAEGDSPEEAATIANAYGDVFVDRAAILTEEDRAPSRIAVSEEAVAPEDPSSPNVPLLIGLGALLALLASLAAALLRDRLDRRLPLDEDTESVAELPLLTRIPRGEGFRAMLDPDDNRVYVDALRILRTRLELAGAEPTRTVLITSPDEGEGKSALAASLALNIARDGANVTLIEGDLRRPTLDLSAVAPGLDPTGPGLVTFLGGAAPVSEIIRTDPSLPRLRVFYSGSPGLDPGPLLHSQELDYLIKARKLAGDWVIVDAPPALIGDDALILSSRVDGVVLVVDATATSLPDLRASAAQLKRVGARLLGVVANRAPVKQSSSYYSRGARDIEPERSAGESVNRMPLGDSLEPDDADSNGGRARAAATER